jgi:putative AlgH/UPF0301 family transcriptional regulator
MSTQGEEEMGEGKEDLEVVGAGTSAEELETLLRSDLVDEITDFQETYTFVDSESDIEGDAPPAPALQAQTAMVPAPQSEGSDAKGEGPAVLKATESAGNQAPESKPSMQSQKPLALETMPPGTDAMCRYCFCGAEEDGQLISPCKCKGGQKFVHLECLRRWQRSVIVSQPTHPAFYERDERQFICNVCRSEFSISPPSRAEMMQSFTGEELASLLQTGCFIVATKESSRDMAQMLRTNGHIRQVRSMVHWIESVYIVYQVDNDGASDGEDGINAVNVTRQVNPSTFPALVQGIIKPGAFNDEANVLMYKHYIGGPCMPFFPSVAMVSIQAHHADEIKANDNVFIVGNMWVASTDHFEVAKIAKTDCERRVGESAGSAAPAAVVHVFWGVARWSRTQLLGELARGSWGMCRAEKQDLFSNADEGNSGWKEMIDSNRLIYANENEMTEEYARRRTARSRAPARSDEEEEAAVRELAETMRKQREELRAKLLAQQDQEAKKRKL